MTPVIPENTIRFALPKGRMEDGIRTLLRDAGVGLRSSSRSYRPTIDLDPFEVKVLKPRAIIEMLDIGARDLGFAGADWVDEIGADLVEILDTGLDRVRLVAAAPESILLGGTLPSKELVIASEYPNIAQRWIESKGLNASVLRSYGATEVLPPEDADCIIDNTATGSTLAANDLRIIDEITTSSTRLYASKSAMADPIKRERINAFAMLIQSVLEARSRVMLEVNVSSEDLERVIEALPCMREPTVAPMHGNAGYAVKAAVPRRDLPSVIPELKSRGATDIIVTTPDQIVP